MKKVFLIIASVCFMSIYISAQTVNGISIDKLDSEFVTVTKHIEASGAITIGALTINSPVHGRVLVEFGNGDYSTNLKRKRNDEAELKDSSGNIFNFNSATEAITFLDNNGYDLIDFNITPFGESSLMTTYMMARRAKTEE